MAAAAYDRAGACNRNFYLGRIREIYDLEKLSGHEDIWKINSVKNIGQKENKDCNVTIRYQEYGNIRHDYKKRENEKVITVKGNWVCYQELMERFICMMSVSGG